MPGRALLLCCLLVAAMPASALTIYKYTDANGVVTYTDKAVSGAQVFVFRDRMVERLDRSVKLETQKHDAGETLLVRNDLFAPVEVELSLENVSNAVGDPGRPIRWVLPRAARSAWSPSAPRTPARPCATSHACVTPWATPGSNPRCTATRCPGSAAPSA